MGTARLGSRASDRDVVAAAGEGGPDVDGIGVDESEVHDPSLCRLVAPTTDDLMRHDPGLLSVTILQPDRYPTHRPFSTSASDTLALRGNLPGVS